MSRAREDRRAGHPIKQPNRIVAVLRAGREAVTADLAPNVDWTFPEGVKIIHFREHGYAMQANVGGAVPCREMN